MADTGPSDSSNSKRAADAPRPADRLVVSNLSKQFPGTLALDDVDFTVAAGEVHALCGGNGSGKSTLIKILAGVYKGEPGGLVSCGGIEHRADQMNPATSHEMGIRVVHQDLGVFADMTVAENLSLGSGFETTAGRIRWGQVTGRARSLIDRFEIPATPKTLLRSLSRAAQTQVAIARALQDSDEESGGLLILDEPTASLPAHEVEVLLTAVRRLAQSGHSIVFVSHRLDEVLDISSRLTVLRDGVSVGTRRADELDEARLIELILGRMVDAPPPNRARRAERVPALEVRGLAAGPLREVSFDVMRGEVLGVAGLLGSGRSELLRAIFGDLETRAGEMRLDGEPLKPRRPADAMRRGVALVPEDRAVDAAFPDLPVYMNLAQTVFGSYFKGLRLRDGQMRADGAGLVADFGVKTASVRSPLRTLSGGNQQKVILARWLRREPRLLLLDEPTVGVDVGARAEIYKFVRQAVEQGAAVIVVASDYEELLHVADRAIVLHEGRMVGVVEDSELTVQHLTELSYTEERV